MRFVDVDPADERQLETVTALVEEARVVDDPGFFPQTIEDTRLELRYGGDLHPARFVLCFDDPSDGDVPGEAVGLFSVDAPVHDNRHLVMAELTVRPDRRGPGSDVGLDQLMLDEIVRRTRELGRRTLWVRTGADDVETTGLLERNGLVAASRDARRHQVLATVDPAAVDRLERDAAEHGRDYDLVRIDPPYDDDLLQQLVAVTAAINDAPMGSLDFEDEVYDLARLRDAEQAQELGGRRVHRVIARHRTTGEIGGHTFVVVSPWSPAQAYQWDTAVAREHRGHRLGIALKIAMMRWLAEAEPQVEVVATWNNVDNTPMISVNEALGYRLAREYVTFQRLLPREG